MSLPKELEDLIKENIKEAERELANLEPELAKAKMAGIAREDLEAEVQRLKQQIANLKSVYLKK